MNNMHQSVKFNCLPLVSTELGKAHVNLQSLQGLRPFGLGYSQWVAPPRLEFDQREPRFQTLSRHPDAEERATPKPEPV